MGINKGSAFASLLCGLAVVTAFRSVPALRRSVPVNPQVVSSPSRFSLFTPSPSALADTADDEDEPEPLSVAERIPRQVAHLVLVMAPARGT